MNNPPQQRTRAWLAGSFHRRINASSVGEADQISIGSKYENGQRVRMSFSDLNTHLLAIGTTRSGKTNSIMNFVEYAIDNAIPVVIVDGKGDVELARQVERYAKGRSACSYIFDGLAPDQSCTYNPLASGNFTSKADRVIAIRDWSEPYYRSLAIGYAQIVFKTFDCIKKETDLVRFADALSMAKLLSEIKGAKLPKADAQALADEIGTQKEAEKNMTGLRSDMRNFSQSVFRPAFDVEDARRSGRSVLELAKARSENAVVYFALPALTYPETANNLGKLIINDIKACLPASRSPWLMVFDEFSVFSGDQVLNIINMGRSFGAYTILATQSLADISRGVTADGASFVDQLLGSINTYLVHRVNAPSDAEKLAGLIGTLEVTAFTEQTVGRIATGAASAREARDFRVHPDTLKSLPNQEAWLFEKSKHRIENILVRKSKI